MVIQGAEIQDLSPLRVIRTIDGELVIGSDTTMPTLNGLQGLSHVGGKAVVDTDGDYHPDFMDAFPNDPAAAFDTDQDGFPNDWLPGYFSSTEDPDLVADADDDNDGVTDFEDAFPLDASESSDTMGMALAMRPIWMTMAISLATIRTTAERSVTRISKILTRTAKAMFVIPMTTTTGSQMKRRR